MVEIEHEGIGAFDEYPVVVFVFLEEGELIDDVWLEFLAVFLFYVRPNIVDGTRRDIP